MGSTTAKCIFDLLTAKNPVVKYPEPTSMSNTTSTAWFTPRQVTHWDEFKFETLEAIYGGELMDEARRSVNHLPPYPYIKPAVDCVVWDEDSTVHLLTKWNHSIVTAGLDAVEKFQHCEWVPWVQTTRDEEDSVADKTTKLRRPRSCSQDISYGRKRSSRRLRPDAGGSISSSRSTDTTNGSQQLTESFPKEYKTASKWKSSAVFEKYLVQETGQWKPNLSRKNDLMPIRQIYSYCVRHECRYGCILTTAEAFIFRIKPREARPGPIHVTGPSDRKDLKRRLAVDGIMEYVSVPWDNYRQENSAERINWTMNLALWFVHILAGNGHQVSWNYDALTSETPKPPAPNTSVSAESAPPTAEGASRMRSSAEAQQESSSASLQIFSKKRKRITPEEDVIHLSFPNSHIFPSRSTDSPTEQGTQSEASDVSEEKELTTGGNKRPESWVSQRRSQRLLSMGMGGRAVTRRKHGVAGN